MSKPFSEMDWDEQGRFMQNVHDGTPTKDVVEILEQCCNALNHEDENYVPAIRQAIRRLRNV